MKLLVPVLLTAFVLSFVLGGEDECVGEGLQVCLDILRIDANSDEEECGVVRSSVECVRDIVKECLCDDRVKELSIGIERLEKLSRKLCQTEGVAANEKITSISDMNCMKMPLFRASNLLDDGESNCTDEQAKGCLRPLASKFRSQEESCREINRAVNCLVEFGKECLDDYNWQITDLEKLFVRRCEREEDIEECPELLTEDFGILYSTRFPRNRRGLMDCYTRIKGKEDEVIRINIDWMGVYSEDNCTSDYFEIIYDDSSNNITKHFLDKTDRSLCQDSYVYTGRNSVLIHFHSEDPINDMGYKVVYKSMEESHSPAVLGFNEKNKKHFPKCVQENADFILGCISKYTDDIQAATLIENEGYNMRYTKCSDYRYMSECFVERTMKKCDEDDVLWANSTISDLLKSDPDSKRCIGTYSFEALHL